MEFVAAHDRSAAAEHAVRQKPRGAITEMQLAPGEARCMAKQPGHGVALATVVETWGSAPRPAGSSLVINDDGTFLGSVSGGCVEGAVVTEALDVIASGKPKMLEFGVADETAWNVGLSCGGTIRVFVE